MITSLYRQSEVAASFWRNNDFIIASRVCWDHDETLVWNKHVWWKKSFRNCDSQYLVLLSAVQWFDITKTRQNNIVCITTDYIQHIENETRWLTFFRRHFKRILFHEKAWISIWILLTFVPKGPINNNPALVQIMAWRRIGAKPLSEAMMT